MYTELVTAWKGESILQSKAENWFKMILLQAKL